MEWQWCANPAELEFFRAGLCCVESRCVPIWGHHWTRPARTSGFLLKPTEHPLFDRLNRVCPMPENDKAASSPKSQDTNNENAGDSDQSQDEQCFCAPFCCDACKPLCGSYVISILLLCSSVLFTAVPWGYVSFSADSLREFEGETICGLASDSVASTGCLYRTRLNQDNSSARSQDIQTPRSG